MAKKEKTKPSSNGEAFPKIVREAFAPGEKLFAGGEELQPINLGAIIVLEQIESPLIRKEVNLAEMTNIELATAAYVLTRDPDQAMEDLQQGRPHFDRKVVAFAAKIPTAEFLRFGSSIREHLTRAFSTAIPAGPPDEKKTANPDPQPSAPSSTSGSATPASVGG